MRQELIKQMLKQQLEEKTDNVELPTTSGSSQLGTEAYQINMKKVFL